MLFFYIVIDSLDSFKNGVSRELALSAASTVSLVSLTLLLLLPLLRTQVLLLFPAALVVTGDNQCTQPTTAVPSRYMADIRQNIVPGPRYLCVPDLV